MFSVEISLVSILVSILLCFYVYKKDRIEKEPLWLLVLLFIVGAVVFLPASYLQKTIFGAIDGVFKGDIIFSPEGVTSFSGVGTEVLYNALVCLASAFAIEGFKWLCLFSITAKNRNFNCLFDGIVYSAFVSLGFAAAENLVYSYQNGFDNLVLRSLVTVPSHLFFGIFMGFFYSVWHTVFAADKLEKELIVKEVLTVKKMKSSAIWLVLSVFSPITLNFLFNFCASFSNYTMKMIFDALTVIIYVVCVLFVNRFSLVDGATNKIAAGILLKKHPEKSAEDIGFSDVIIEEEEPSDE